MSPTQEQPLLNKTNQRSNVRLENAIYHLEEFVKLKGRLEIASILVALADRDGGKLDCLHLEKRLGQILPAAARKNIGKNLEEVLLICIETEDCRTPPKSFVKVKAAPVNPSIIHYPSPGSLYRGMTVARIDFGADFRGVVAKAGGYGGNTSASADKFFTKYDAGWRSAGDTMRFEEQALKQKYSGTVVEKVGTLLAHAKSTMDTESIAREISAKVSVLKFFDAVTEAVNVGIAKIDGMTGYYVSTELGKRLYAAAK